MIEWYVVMVETGEIEDRDDPKSKPQEDGEMGIEDHLTCNLHLTTADSAGNKECFTIIQMA